jgi:tetratricopeptide (TPR) repeat protein
MPILPEKVRVVIAHHNSYRMANRLKLTLQLAEYQQRNVFEVIEANQLLHLLQELAPIHVAIITPTIFAQLEKPKQSDLSWAHFPQVALLLLGDQDDCAWHNKETIMPDYTLTLPFTAETLAQGIAAALSQREKRAQAIAYITQGEIAVQQGLAVKAQMHFARALQVDTHDPFPCYLLGDLFADMGHAKQAVAAYTLGWKRRPSCMIGIKRTVNLLLAHGKKCEAIPYLESARQQGIAPLEGLILLGVLYLETGVPAQATSAIQAASRIDANRAITFLLEQAHALLQRQGMTEATTLLQIGRDMQPENAQLYRLLGDLYMQQEQYRDALSCYETHLRLNDPDPLSYCRLAQAYLALGYPLRAELALEKALKIDPDFAEATQLRRLVYR